jgi:MYXO-CTERM domain-containing protein
MTPVGTPVNGKGPIERNQSNGDTLAGDGHTITLDRIAYPRGIGVHAPSDIRYNLSDACTGHFIADVGVDDSVGDQGSVVFQVFLDGVKAFDSGIMRGDDNRQPVNISLAGKNSLRLVVTDGGDGNTFDVANWGGARVTGCPPLPEEESEPVVTGPVIVPPSGGGGCTIGGDGRFDPTLPGLLVAALALLGLRRRKRN